MISSVYLPRCRIQTPGAESTALAATPKQILLQLRHSLPPSRLHALNVEALSSPLASSPAEKFSWPLPISQECKHSRALLAEPREPRH